MTQRVICQSISKDPSSSKDEDKEINLYLLADQMCDMLDDSDNEVDFNNFHYVIEA